MMKWSLQSVSGDSCYSRRLGSIPSRSPLSSSRTERTLRGVLMLRRWRNSSTWMSRMMAKKLELEEIREASPISWRPTLSFWAVLFMAASN